MSLTKEKSNVALIFEIREYMGSLANILKERKIFKTILLLILISRNETKIIN